MTDNQFRICIAAISIVIFLLLWTILTPAGWAWVGLGVLCISFCWVGSVLVGAIEKVWRQR